MLLNRLLEKQPRQFEYILRALGYLMISLIVGLYYYLTPTATNQIFVPVVFLAILILTPRLSRWLRYRYDQQMRQYLFFLIDICVIATALAAVQLSLVLTFIALFVIVFIALYYKISFLLMSFTTLAAILVFYFNIFFIFGYDDYFQQTPAELTIVSFLAVIFFVNMASYYQQYRIVTLAKQRDHYYQQMARYLELSNQLSRYAPLQLWHAIMRGDSEAKLEYKRKKMTVFFSDIQGFTELSESLIPDDLAFLLNDYLSEMTDIAKQYGGTIAKFMGDAILIFFGDPETQGVVKDAKGCVEMALAMRQRMKLMRERWQKMGYPALHIRMGISTGYCHVGNYGTTHRMAYTIVGRDANLAARLQSAADVDEILISEDTYKLIKDDFLCAPQAPLHLKGIQGAVKTWQVLERFSKDPEHCQQWFDYQYKGFHLVLNLQEVQNFEYDQLLDVLEKMTDRVKKQQELTTQEGSARLDLSDEVTDLQKNNS